MSRLFRKRGNADTATSAAMPATANDAVRVAATDTAVEMAVEGSGVAVGSGDNASAQKPPTKRRRWLGAVQIIVVIVVIIGALIYARAPSSGGPPPALANLQDDPLPIVSVVRPVASPTTIKVAATGTASVRNYVALTPQVGGRVVSISPALRAGGTFSAGDELLVIDRRDFELALDQARAEVATARSTLLLQQAQSDAARANYALLHPEEPSENVPSLVARVPQIAQAQAQLSAARARTEIALLNLQRTRFSLPFDGRVTESTAEVGQVLVARQSFGRAFSFDALEVVVPIAAADLDRIAPAIGRSATVRTDTGTVSATVERVSAELDQRTRFAELYLRLAPETRPPPPGSFANVVVDGPDIERTFVLPAAAEQTNRSVWIVSRGSLEPVMPRTLGNTAQGWTVEAFDYKDGVVLGAVPAAEGGLQVAITGEAQGRLRDTGGAGSEG